MSFNEEEFSPSINKLLLEASALEIADYLDYTSFSCSKRYETLSEKFKNIENKKYIQLLENATPYLAIENEDNLKKLEEYRSQLQSNIKEANECQRHKKEDCVKVREKLNRYNASMTILKKKLEKLSPGNEDLVELQFEIKELYEKIKAVRSKCDGIKKELEKYKELPPDIFEGKKVLAKTRKELQDLKMSCC